MNRICLRGGYTSLVNRVEFLIKSLLLILVIVSPILPTLSSRYVSIEEPLASSNYVVVVEVKGTIDYGIAELVKEGIAQAEALNGILVIVLDTPGGYLDAAEEIVTLIRQSRVPVVGFVYPKGAWSAGTLILLATHVAAMAPGTIIGSLQPVMYNPATGEYQPVNFSKIIEPVRKLAETLAKQRGRNVTVATKFVTENLNLEASEALEYNVIEFIANNVNDLISKINGYIVKIDTGSSIKLVLDNPEIIYYGGSIRARVIHFLSDPIINGILATLGIMIILFSILSGHFVITPIGIALLILSLVGTGFSANTASLALIIIGAIALSIELFVTPGFGVLGFTGILMIAIGMALMPLYTPGWVVSGEYQKMLFWTAISIAIVMGVFTGFVVYKAIQAKRKPPTLRPNMVGKIGRAVDDIKSGGEGFVIVDGEYWRAKSTEDIKAGDKILVIGKEGPLLVVKKHSLEKK